MAVEKEIREFTAIPTVAGTDLYLTQDSLNVTQKVTLDQIKAYCNVGGQPLNANLTSLAALSALVTGIVVKTGATSYTVRTLVAGSNKISITNADGVGAAPTLDVQEANLTIAQTQVTNLVANLAAKQPIDATLTALAGYNTNGILVQTATDTFAGRTIVCASIDQIVITNGDGVLGNPTLTLPQDISAASFVNFTSMILSSHTANRVVVSDGTKELISSAITNVQLGYLGDVTSLIQAQLNGKEPLIGTLSIAKGGTNANAFTTNQFLYYNGTSIVGSQLVRWYDSGGGALKLQLNLPGVSGYNSWIGLRHTNADPQVFTAENTDASNTFVIYSDSNGVSLSTNNVLRPLEFIINTIRGLVIAANGDVAVGISGADGLNTATGYLYIPSCAGTPIGVPTGVTGKIPIRYDSTNNILYAYSNAAWRVH